MSGFLITALNTFNVIGIILAAVAAVRAEKVITSVLALAACGTFVGLEFIMLQAPDVAIAEVSVGAVLSTVLYVIAVRRTHADEEEKEAE